MKQIVKDIIQWDIRNWSHCLEFWRDHSQQNFKNLNALEIGAREGGLSLWLAINGCEVTCSDIDYPDDRAKSLHKKYNVHGQIHYESIDVTNIPFKDHFDIIVLKSVLGGIRGDDDYGIQQRAVEQIHQSLKTGGELFFAENLSASPVHQFLRKKCLNWGDRWKYPTIDEIVNYLEIFKTSEYTVRGYLGALGRSEWQRMILGELDNLIFNWITPVNWRYIMIGLARK
jgi:SAM-dependent methyltransferase